MKAGKVKISCLVSKHNVTFCEKEGINFWQHSLFKVSAKLFLNSLAVKFKWVPKIFDTGLMNDCYVLFEYGYFSCLPRLLANGLIDVGSMYKKGFGRTVFSEPLSCFSHASRLMQSFTAATGVVSESSRSFCHIFEPPHTAYGEDLTSCILPDQNVNVSRVRKHRKTE